MSRLIIGSDGLMFVDLVDKQKQNSANELKRFRIPTSRRQTSGLCANAAEELNKGLTGTTPADGQSGE